MSIRRLVATAAVMGGIAVVLGALTPAFPGMADAVADAQRTVDSQGADVLVASAAGLLAWGVWAWGALGLVLTAASAVPGAVGGAARTLLHVALPAGARRSAALLLGIGLGISAPLAGAVLPALAASASASTTAQDVAMRDAAMQDVARQDVARQDVARQDLAAQDVPDWPAPAQPAAPVPDWPRAAPAAALPSAAPAPGDRVVVRGDCLWHIAADSLLGQLGRLPDDAEVAAAVDAWWRANAEVIGPDPDLLRPGQVLRAPGPP